MRNPRTRLSQARRLSSLIAFPRPPSPLSSTSFGHNRRGRGTMPLHLWGMDRRARDVWRTCICFHVRTVTIFIGVWYLMLYILALSFTAALFMYEPSNDGTVGNGMTKIEQLLPTPQSKSSVELENAEALTRDFRVNEEEFTPRSRIEQIKSGPWSLILETRKPNSQFVLLNVCNMLITLLMVYGAVRGKASYLMPFFILKVFEFCIFCLTMVGFFSYLPNVTEMISKEPNLPYREELLQMDPQLLSLLTLLLIVATIALKAYVIGVVWNCYKYLMLRNTVIRGVITYRHDDPTNIIGLQQNLLPDLPDYDTAINDPRYAKKPPMDGTPAPTPARGDGSGNNASVTPSAGSISIAPPPYSVAIASEPFNIVTYPVVESQVSQQAAEAPQEHQQQQAPATAEETEVGPSPVEPETPTQQQQQAHVSPSRTEATTPRN
jgi:lysosomal-associated transmembrane protein